MEEKFKSEDLYNKLNELKVKYGFMTDAMRNLISNEDYQADDDTVHGFQLIMYSLENEFNEIKIILDKMLDKQRLFQSAKAGITMTEEGAWISREVAIQELKESIDKMKKFINHSNESKEKAEGLLKNGEKLLQRYQAA